MRTLLFLLLFLVPQKPATLLEPARVSITASGDSGVWLADELREALRKSGRVAIRTKSAQWNVFLDVAPLQDLGCSGYSAVVYVTSSRRGGTLRTYAGVSLQAIAREVAAKLETEFDKK